MLRIREFISGAAAYFCDAMDRNRRLWLFLCIVSLFSLADIPGGTVFGLPYWFQVVYLASVSVLKGSIILLILHACRKKTVLRIISWLLVFVFILLALINIGSHELYGFGITRHLIFILLQTNAREAHDFLADFMVNSGNFLLSAKFICFAVSATLAFLLVGKIDKKIFCGIISAVCALGTVLAVGFALRYTSGRSAHSLLLRSAKFGKETYSDIRRFEDMRLSMGEFPDSETVSSRNLAATVVFVIGESASRTHWSLYGYPLPTVPWADAAKDSLFVFTDAIGSSAGTSGNLERILTFKKDDFTSGDGIAYPRVIDMFNTAGYRTYWLSNQEKTGLVSNVSSVLSSNADVIRYVGSESSEDALIFKYDEALLPDFNCALADTAGCKMIFMHLIGSHFPYEHRYPATEAVFTAKDETDAGKRPRLSDHKAAIVAHYDNSIRYTDKILAIIADNVARRPEPSIMVYLSDHGECVYDDGEFRGRNEETVRIPFIIYANAAYRRENPEMMKKLEGAVDKPFSSANIVYPLMSLTGTRYAAYDSTYDILSKSFITRKRNVDEKPWQHTR